MCVVFSVARPHSQVVSPSLYRHLCLCSLLHVNPVRSRFRHLHVVHALLNHLAKLLTVALCGIVCSLLSHALHRITLGGSQQTSHYARNSSSTLAFSLTGSDHIESERQWFPVWSFPLEHIHLSGCRVAQFQPASTCLLHWLASGIL